ncbi:MAG: amidase [Chloroflexota bacterium]
MDDPTPLHFRSATDLARMLAAGETSSVEVVEACLARIEEVNPAVNAVVQLAPDARERAREADAARRRGDVRGPLHGIPFTLKDSLDTAGVVTTAGTAGWRDRLPVRDATVVARLRAAGGILLGKTNTPEFTWSNETDNDVYGRTSNPYDLARTPGGSSGGPAAAVAAGCSPFDIGSDTGNSIRQPAHVCGIAGIKPTSGRVPRTGHWPGPGGLLDGLTQLGPMARRVEDLALVLPVISGPDGEDPHIAPVPLGAPASVTVTGLRVALFTDNGVQTPTPETIAAVEAAGRALEDAGAGVEPALPPDISATSEVYRRLAGADGYAWLRRLVNGAGTPGLGSYETRPWFAEGHAMSGDELTALIEHVDDLRTRMLRWLAPFDLVVCPAMPLPAVPHGAGLAPDFADGYSDVHNITGWPSVVVRGGTAPGGLPIGVQVVGGPWREDVALAGALVVERASGGWVRPPR